VIVLAPVIYNMFVNVRKIARQLTVLAVESPRGVGSNPLVVYKIFVNLAYAALIMVILVLIIPLMPNLIMVGPLGLIVSLFAGLIILALAWDTISRVYVRFCAMVAGTIQDDNEMEKK
jgi:uncharacterized membrane protein SpoIIM required for sporulation